MGLFESIIQSEPTLTYGSAVDWAADDFLEDFESYWGLAANDPPEGADPDDWRRLNEIRQLAQKMALGAGTLIRPRRLSSERIALPEVLRFEASEHQKMVDSILDKISKMSDSESRDDLWWSVYKIMSAQSPDDPRVQRAIFETYFEHNAYKTFGSSAKNMAARMERLMPHLLSERGEFTSAYLTRVAGCYVRDMRPEFAVMARAVLDSAIQERIDDAGVLKSIGGQPNSDVTLAPRIQACLATGLFSDSAFDAAQRLREAGRVAAHVTPGLEGDLDSLLQDLIICLRSLE